MIFPLPGGGTERGVSFEQLVGFLVWSAGLRETPEPTAARDLLADFDLAKVPRQLFVFTEEMLRELIGN